LKRAPFLGAGAAAFLAGCGGHHVIQALPGVAPFSSVTKPKSGLRLVPDVADTIPDSVLTGPIIGEARRFDGAAAPNGWLFARGQALNVADNPKLFAILGRIAGGDRTTFNLPAPGFGLIIAVAGMAPTSPSMLAASRHVSPTVSLGPGARVAPPRFKSSRFAQVMADRRLLPGGVRVGRLDTTPVSPELAARFRQATADAAAAALERLSPANRGRLESATQDYLSGRISLNDAVSAIAVTLSSAEADAVLQANDAMNQPFKDRGYANRYEHPQSDAGRFLFSVTITREQIDAAAAKGVELR
jgi:tail collar domain